VQLVPPDAGTGLPPLPRIQSELARRSLAEFVKKSWHVLEKSTPLLWNWHLDAMCMHVQALLEGRIPRRKLLITVPPGSMKSRIVSVCAPAWWWLEHSWWRAIFASANPRVTIRDSVYCRQLIDSAWYQESFSPRWTFAPDQNAKSLYYTTEGGFRMAASASQAITGDRAHTLFWDDLLDAKDARTSTRERRESVNWWHDVAFSNRLADPEHGTECGISQRLHEDDPAGHVLKTGGWEHLNIPQIYEAPRPPKGSPEGTPPPAKPRTILGWQDPRSTEGQLMFPRRFTSRWLRGEKRILGTAMFEAQHQQRPNPLGGTVFKRAWWKFYRRPPNWRDLPVEALKELLGIDRVATGWDTALTEKRENDNTSSTTIGEGKGRFLILDHLNERMEFPEAKRRIITTHARWQTTAVPIEGGGSASGKAAVQSLHGETRVPAIEVENIAKEVRASLVAPTVEAGIVYIPEDAEWAEGFIASLAAFPRAAHDDDVDSFCITLHWLLYGTKRARPRAVVGG
jgi:predicted phage terminase large subunit-like protein